MKRILISLLFRRPLILTQRLFFSLAALFQPMKESRDLTDQAAEPHPEQAMGLSFIKEMYLR